MNHQIDINDREFLEERYGKLTTWVPGAVDQKTGKINPQVTQVHLGGNTFASLFHVKPVYYETYTGHWRPLSEVTVHHGNHKIEFNNDWWKVHPRYMAWLDKRMQLINGQLLIPSLYSIPTPYAGVLRSLHESFVPVKMGLTTSTFYPDPDPETTTVDGHVYYDNYTGSWATVRNATNGQGASDNNTQLAVYVGNYNPGSDAYWIYRSAMLFDTSAIADSDTIDSATLSLWPTTVVNDDLSLTNKSFRLVTSTPASNTAIVADDYEQFGTTAGGTDVAITSLSVGSYSWTYTLNATGLGWISKTGVTKLGLRHTADADDEAPDAPGYADDYNMAYCSSADNSGTSQDPKLAVVHTAGAVATYQRRSNLALLGVS